LCPDNFDACKGEERKFFPKLDDFFAEAVAQADPKSQVENKYKLTLNENFQWRACRLLSMYSPHFYTVNTSAQYLKIPEFLNDMVEKVAQDYPDRFGKEKAKVEVDDVNIQESQETTIEEEDIEEPVEMVAVTKVSRDVLNKLAKTLQRDWQKLQSYMQSIDPDFPIVTDEDDPSMCCFIVLETWVNRHERSATTENMVRVLEEADLYGEDVAAILKPSEEHQQQEAPVSAEGKKE